MATMRNDPNMLHRLLGLAGDEGEGGPAGDLLSQLGQGAQGDGLEAVLGPAMMAAGGEASQLGGQQPPPPEGDMRGNPGEAGQMGLGGTREDRRKLLEEEAWRSFTSGEVANRPPMKLEWREILAVAMNKNLLPVLLERKMAPYYDQLERQKRREAQVMGLLGMYSRPTYPVNTQRGALNPETGQIIPGTEPIPEPKVTPGGALRPNLEGGYTDEIIPGTEPPDRNTLRFHAAPGRPLTAYDPRQMKPGDTVPGTEPNYRPYRETDRAGQIEGEARRYGAAARREILDSLNDPNTIYGSKYAMARTPEEKAQIEAEAAEAARRAEEREYQNHMKRYGQQGATQGPNGPLQAGPLQSPAASAASPGGAPRGASSRATTAEQRYEELEREYSQDPSIPDDEVQRRIWETMDAEGWE